MGKIKVVNDFYKRIVEWLKNHDQETSFTAAQIAAELDLNARMITTFLHRKTIGGYLKKEAHGKYLIVDATIPFQANKGNLSNLVFELLKKLNLEFPEGYVRESLLAKKLDVPTNGIHSILQKWFASGYLIRNSRGKGYRFKEMYLHMSERPTVTKSFKETP